MFQMSYMLHDRYFVIPVPGLDKVCIRMRMLFIALHNKKSLDSTNTGDLWLDGLFLL